MMKKTLLLLLMCTLGALISHAQISGTVYRDFNKDNIFQKEENSKEFGIDDVEVVVTDIGTGKIVARTKSNTLGYYFLKVLKNNQYRISFTFPLKYLTPEFGASSFLESCLIANNGDKNVNYGLKPTNK